MSNESSKLSPASTQENISSRTGTHDIYVQVEAFGSGVVLHEALSVAVDATVGELRRRALSVVALPPRTRTVRLFVGHGGAELDDDAKLVSDTAIAAGEIDETPLVLFPTLCTLYA